MILIDFDFELLEYKLSDDEDIKQCLTENSVEKVSIYPDRYIVCKVQK